VATAAWAGAPDAGVSPAAALNTAGFRLYQQKKYAEALEQFKQAIAADEQHALSHYNYAATLALLRKQGRVCEFDAYCPVVLDHLERAVQLDEGRRRRMQRDPYFDTVRDTVRYQRLLGRDPAREADARALLVAVTWLGAAPGAFGNMAELRFKADGTFTLSRKVLDDQGEVKTVKVSGRFTVRRFDVTLELGSPLDGKKKLSGRLGADGRLSLDALGELSDERAECDA
jgi:tetratricopeptide (TPR) repeat protein